MDIWRKCSSCKKPIVFGQRYYECSVSTCNGQRTGYVFCSVPCWETHLPGARHKDAAAIETRAPTAAQAKTASGTESSRRIVVGAAPTAASTGTSAAPKEILIVASRLKDYIQARADMNTSAGVMEVLSDFVRLTADRAIENARADGRKTVLDRDFVFLKK